MKHTAQNLIMVYNMVLHAIQQVQYQEKHSQKSQYILHLFRWFKIVPHLPYVEDSDLASNQNQFWQQCDLFIF